MVTKWDSVHGTELEELYVKGRPMADLVPPSPAVYLWRHAPQVPYDALHDSTTFAEWLDRTMQVPTGEIKDQRLSHFAMLNHLTLQSPGLTDIKKQQLVDIVSTPKRRSWLANYVRQLRQFSPPIYCGETTDLSKRTKEHLSGETGFGHDVRAQRVPPWSALELRYYPLDRVQPKDEVRAREFSTLLELITTAFAVAAYVSRRG